MSKPSDELAIPPRLLASPGSCAPPLLAPALAGAALLHLLLILSISSLPSKPPPVPETALEVLILSENGQATRQPAPDAARSQRNRIGASPGGDAVVSSQSDLAPPTELTPAEPDPVPPDILPDPQPAPPPEPPASRTPSETPSGPQTPAVLAAQTPPKSRPPPPPDPLAPREIPVDAAQILASRGQEIHRLTTSLEARATAYASRVRRKSVSASTREFRYANYLGAWARKVERIGNLNYPAAAREQHLYGSLILHVAVRADGSVENIRLVRSSGFALLDEAAIQIVELAAPYSPFPPDIAAETDVLDIIRTWQFTRGGVLGWER